MIDIKKSWQLFRRNQKIWPEGEDGLTRISHRDMVGGLWDEIGQLQFSFLKNRGLEPTDTLLEVGCGCFRAGRFFIAYLDQGLYTGLDKEEALVSLGIKEELSEELVKLKKPNIIISDNFNFDEVRQPVKYAIAQSLFTHLTLKDIGVCMKNLAGICDEHTQFYATFFEVPERLIHLGGSHSGKNFIYTKTQMSKVGAANGWRMEYIGDWGHPRDQKIVRYILTSTPPL